MITVYIKSFDGEDTVLVKDNVITMSMTPNTDATEEQFYEINNRSATCKNIADAQTIFDLVDGLVDNDRLELFYDINNVLQINKTP